MGGALTHLRPRRFTPGRPARGAFVTAVT